MSVAKAHRGQSRRHRVPVPPDLRRALATLIATRGCTATVVLLGVSDTVLYDAVAPGGIITAATLERLVGAVARVQKGAA